MRIVPRAIGHRVVVKPYSLAEADPMLARAQALGITLQPVDERKLATGVDRGTVVEVGPNAFSALNVNCPDVPWCKVGDLIAYTKNAGKYIKTTEEALDSLLVINDEDVVAVLEEQND
jgi:co-chaperonin GroES (HSP10)